MSTFVTIENTDEKQLTLREIVDWLEDSGLASSDYSYWTEFGSVIKFQLYGETEKVDKILTMFLLRFQ